MIAAHPGRRWGIAERGWLAGPARADTIRREMDWLAGDELGRTCGLYLAWSTGGTEGEPGWVLDEPARAALEDGYRRLAEPPAPAVPAGYRASPLDGFVVSLRDGCLVDATMVASHDAGHTS